MAQKNSHACTSCEKAYCASNIGWLVLAIGLVMISKDLGLFVDGVSLWSTLLVIVGTYLIIVRDVGSGKK